MKTRRVSLFCAVLWLVAPLAAQQSGPVINPRTPPSPPTNASAAPVQEDSPKTEGQPSPLPKIEDLERAAKAVHMTIAACRETAATTEAYWESSSTARFTDNEIYKLSLQAFSCMQMGSRAARYGYQIKSIVDIAYEADNIRTAMQVQQTDATAVEKQQQETIEEAKDALSKAMKDMNALVNQYNSLVVKYNILLGLANEAVDDAVLLQDRNKQIYAIVNEALGRNSYSPPPAVIIPSVPSTITIKQSPLHCMTQTIGTFAYTNCF